MQLQDKKPFTSHKTHSYLCPAYLYYIIWAASGNTMGQYTTRDFFFFFFWVDTRDFNVQRNTQFWWWQLGGSRKFTTHWPWANQAPRKLRNIPSPCVSVPIFRKFSARSSWIWMNLHVYLPPSAADSVTFALVGPFFSTLLITYVHNSKSTQRRYSEKVYNDFCGG